MKKPLRGTFTAVATPFNADGSIDFGSLDKLVDTQLEAGIEGLVPCGSTGEAATLNASERGQVIGRVVKRVAGRVPVIAGTGTNNTAESVEYQKRALEAGADASLVVTPYYNKPSPEGLFRHFAAIAESCELPIIVYNVPSRTNIDMKPDTVCRIATIPGVVGIKEATGDIDRVSAIRKGTGKDFAILSGDDGTTLASVLLGGDGVICTTSNLLPKEFGDMVRLALAKKYDEARALHDKMRALVAVLFVETNPIPLKAAMAMRGVLAENYRLPLCPIGADNRKKLEAAMRAGGWL